MSWIGAAWALAGLPAFPGPIPRSLLLLVDKYLNDPTLDDKNRTLMAFAAYNAGPDNLRKFRRLAERSGLDPNIWFHNVEHVAAEAR